MNAAFTTAETQAETSDKYLPGLESLQILIIRTKKVIIMNILKLEMIAREINYKEGSQFFPSNIRSTWNVRSLQSILTLISLKPTDHILHLQVSLLFLR